MRRVLSLISTAITLAMFVGVSTAQPASHPTAPAKSACDGDADRSFLLIEAEENVPRRAETEISVGRPDSKRKLSTCGLLTLATVRGSTAVSSIKLGALRRPTGLLNFDLLSANKALKTKNGSALAESPQAQSQPAAATEAQELAKKLSNPVASLISLPLQSNFDFGMGTGSGWRYTLNIQPVIPIKLSPNWNLISRTDEPG